MSDTNTPNLRDVASDRATVLMTSRIGVAGYNMAGFSAEYNQIFEAVHASLVGQVVPETVAPVRGEPAVPIKKSVFPDHIVCLEDGKKLKMLKRHLQTSFGMTPEDYRAKWGLPNDYPMVAPNYAATRSKLAKTFGLGRKPADETVDETTEAVDETAKRDAEFDAAAPQPEVEEQEEAQDLASEPARPQPKQARGGARGGARGTRKLADA